MSSTPAIRTKQSKCLVLEAFNNSLIVATLPPLRKSQGGVHLADYSLHRRDEDYVQSGLDFLSSIGVLYKGSLHEAAMDMADGYWDAKTKSITPFTTVVVIGENPAIERMWNPPQFGDILLIGQMASIQYHGLHKLGADTSAENGILIKNFAGDRTVAVNGEADILAVPVENVIGIVARHSELEDWANHGYGTDRTGERTSAAVSH